MSWITQTKGDIHTLKTKRAVILLSVIKINRKMQKEGERNRIT